MIMVIGVKCLTGKFLMQTTGGMLVDVNHDGISVAEVVLPQKLQLETLHLTIGLSWLIFYHLDYYCLPATNLIFPVKMPDDDMITPRLILTKNTKKPPQGRFRPISYSGLNVN